MEASTPVLDRVLNFEPSALLGSTSSVDAGHIYISVEQHSVLDRTSVGKLIAVEGSLPEEYFICVVERITRRNRHLEDGRRTMDQSNLSSLTSDITVQTVLIGVFRAKEGDKSNVFRRGADSFPQINRKAFLIESKNLKHLMSLLAVQYDPDKRLRMGKYVIDEDALAVIDGDRFFQRHAAILGSTGSGKSWTVTLILEQAKALSYPNMVVFDLHGEYKSLCSPKNGYAKRLKIAGPGDLEHFNEDLLYLPYWVLTPDELLTILLDKSDLNAPHQASRFSANIRTLREKTLQNANKPDVRRTFSMSSPIPYSVKELISTMNDEDWEGKLARFTARLASKVEDRLYGFMFKPPDSVLAYEWLANQMIRLLGSGNGKPGIKVIDFSEVPTEVLPLVVGVIARLVFEIQFWQDPKKRTPVTIVGDEAHLYLPSKENATEMTQFTAKAFEKIAKEGRKYGVSLLIVSQRPSDINTTILSQCNNFVILRLTNEHDQRIVHHLMPDHLSSLTDMLPLLEIGEALILGDAVLLPSRVKLTPPDLKPDGMTLDFWSQWGQSQPNESSIKDAVETLRRHCRVKDKDTENVTPSGAFDEV